MPSQSILLCQQVVVYCYPLLISLWASTNLRLQQDERDRCQIVHLPLQLPFSSSLTCSPVLGDSLPHLLEVWDVNDFFKEISPTEILKESPVYYLILLSIEWNLQEWYLAHGRQCGLFRFTFLFTLTFYFHMSVGESKYTWEKNADLCEIGDKEKGRVINWHLPPMKNL